SWCASPPASSTRASRPRSSSCTTMRRRTRRAARRSRSGARWRRRAAGTSSARGGSRARAWWASGRATRSGSWACAPATPSATTRSSSAASAARRREGMRSQPLRRAAAIALLAAACLHPRPEAPPLRVGTSGDYPPFSLARDGRLEGLDVEIARRFAHDGGRRLELVPFRWPELMRDLAAGHFDLAMGGVTLRPERAVAGVFTRPVAEAGAVVLAHQRLDPRSSWLRLGVNAGGHLERLAARLFPHALLVRTHDNRALGELLTSGAADAILTDEAEADALAVPGAVRLGPFTRDRKGYLGRDPALVAELDAWLRAREADGTLAALRAR